MKASIVFLLYAISSVCIAQTDSVFIEKVNGTSIKYAIPNTDLVFVEKIDGATIIYPISSIRKITVSGIPLSVKEQEHIQTVLSSFALYQNFPNPFNPTTTIQYNIPRSGEVNIAVFDIQGRLVRSLANLTQQAGSHTIVWDSRNDGGDNVSSGTYFCRVDFNNAVLVKKLILLK